MQYMLSLILNSRLLLLLFMIYLFPLQNIESKGPDLADKNDTSQNSVDSGRGHSSAEVIQDGSVAEKKSQSIIIRVVVCAIEIVNCRINFTIKLYEAVWFIRGAEDRV